MRNKLCLLILASLGLLMSCNLFPQTQPYPKKVWHSEDDAEMNSAIQNAKDTLPLFIQTMQSPKTSQNYFAIKVEFPYGEGNASEHIWISDLVYEDNQFEGIVESDPSYIPSIQYGDSVTVQITDVTDWIIVDGNNLLGGYTVIVTRNRMTDEEREEYDTEIGVIVPDEPALP